MLKTEKVEKSYTEQIDSLIDELFVEDVKEVDSAEPTDAVKKSDETDTAKTDETTVSAEVADENASDDEDGDMEKAVQQDPMKTGPQKTKADEGEQAKKLKEDEESKTNRPLQVSDVPDVDADGNRAKGYDRVQYPQSKTPDTGPKGTYAKSQTVEVSEEDYELLQKAKKSQEDEELKKVEEKQASLVKAKVDEAVKCLKDDNDKLKKSLDETLTLMKAMSKQPQDRKSVSSIQAIEKAFGSNEPTEGGEFFEKSEMLDAAEELVKSGKISVDDAIELEVSGLIRNPEARRLLEKKLRS